MREITNINQILPANHKILIKVDSDIEKKGGVFIPKSADQKSEIWAGEVISISPGCDLVDACVEKLKPGVVVVTDCNYLTCPQFKIGKDIYSLIDEGEIVCIFK